MKKDIEILLNSNLTSYSIAQETGISIRQIDLYRKKNIGNITLDNALKLHELYKKLNKGVKMKNEIKKFVGDEKFEIIIEVAYSDGELSSSVDILKTSDIDEGVLNYKTLTKTALLRYLEREHALFLKSLNVRKLKITTQYLTVKTATGKFKIIDEKNF